MKTMKTETVAPKKENGTLKKQLAQKEAELAIINSVGEAMSKELDINTVTKIVGDKVREIFNTKITRFIYWIMKK